MGYTLVRKGEETDKSQLFTMGQVIKATGLSRSTSCVPIHPGQEGPEVVVLPACSALMLHYCGDFSELDEAYLLMGREVRDRGLESAGFLRVDTVAGPPLGRDVGLDKYRCRLILPVKEGRY